MKIKVLTVFFLVFLCSGSVLAQDSVDVFYKHAMKVNLASAVFKKVSLGYEYQFNERWSVQVGGGYKFKGEIPKFVGLGDFVVTSNTGGIRGYSVSSDARYHFKKCDCGDKTGLYAGVYLNATKLWGEVQFNYWNGSDYIDVGGAGDLQEYGVGLQLGYQLVIKKRFILDLMFMGPRTSFQRLKLEVDSQFAAEVIPKVEEELNKRLEWWGLDPVSIPTDASAVVDFRFTNFRYSIGLGYIF